MTNTSKPLEDKELVEIFTDGVREAINAIRPSDLMILHYNGSAFMSGLAKAAKAANGLAHTQANTTWLLIRDTLEQVRQTFVSITTTRIIDMKSRRQLAIILEGVYQRSVQIASSRAMTRQTVISNLDRRKEVDARRRNIKLVE